MNKKIIWTLLLSLYLLPASAQRLLLQGSFPIPAATAVTQDVQGNLYLATQQGQVLQYSPKGMKLSSFNPDELLYISSLQALPGLQLLAFDRTNQQLHWIDRFNTLAGSYAVGNDQQATGFIDAVAAAEGNAIWLVDGSRQRLIRQQLPEGEVQLTVPINLATNTTDKLQVKYLREHKGKLYLYSPASGMLIFDIMGNYEQTLKMPVVEDLWFEAGRFYFITKGYLGYLDLETNELIKIPILDKDIEHILVKGTNIWLLSSKEAIRYLLMP